MLFSGILIQLSIIALLFSLNSLYMKGISNVTILKNEKLLYFILLILKTF